MTKVMLMFALQIPGSTSYKIDQLIKGSAREVVNSKWFSNDDPFEVSVGGIGTQIRANVWI